MYCYVLKLLFLITQLYFLKQAATSIYSEVHDLHHILATVSLSITLSGWMLLRAAAVPKIVQDVSSWPWK